MATRSWGHTKPPFGTPLNGNHPLAIGLRGLFLMNEGGGTLFDAVSGAALQLSGGAVWGTNGVLGSALVNEAVSAMANVATPLSLQLQPPITIVWRGKLLGSASSFSGIFGTSSSNNDASPFFGYMFCYDNGPTTVELGHSMAGGANVLASGTMPTGDVFLASTLVDFRQTFYVNDTQTPANTNTSVSGAIVYQGTTQVFFGGYPGTARNVNAVHDVAYIYNRVLSNAELAWLKAEPYAMLQKAPLYTRRLFLSAAGPPTPRLSAAYQHFWARGKTYEHFWTNAASPSVDASVQVLGVAATVATTPAQPAELYTRALQAIPGLVSLWELHDSSTTVAVDLATSPHPGTVQTGVTRGQPSATPSSVGLSTGFPGSTSSYIEMGDFDAASFVTTGKLSVVASFIPSSVTGVQTIVGKAGISGADFEWALCLNGTAVQWLAWDTTGTTYMGASAGALTIGIQYFVVATIDQSATPHGQLYVAAASELTVTTTAGSSDPGGITPTNTLGTVEIGRRGDASQPFSGDTDHVALYNVALTSTQVNTLFASFLAPITNVQAGVAATTATAPGGSIAAAAASVTPSPIDTVVSTAPSRTSVVGSDASPTGLAAAVGTSPGGGVAAANASVLVLGVAAAAPATTPAATTEIGSASATPSPASALATVPAGAVVAANANVLVAGAAPASSTAPAKITEVGTASPVGGIGTASSTAPAGNVPAANANVVAGVAVAVGAVPSAITVVGSANLVGGVAPAVATGPGGVTAGAAINFAALGLAAASSTAPAQITEIGSANASTGPADAVAIAPANTTAGASTNITVATSVVSAIATAPSTTLVAAGAIAQAGVGSATSAAPSKTNAVGAANTTTAPSDALGTAPAQSTVAAGAAVPALPGSSSIATTPSGAIETGSSSTTTSSSAAVVVAPAATAAATGTTINVPGQAVTAPATAPDGRALTGTAAVATKPAATPASTPAGAAARADITVAATVVCVPSTTAPSKVAVVGSAAALAGASVASAITPANEMIAGSATVAIAGAAASDVTAPAERTILVGTGVSVAVVSATTLSLSPSSTPSTGSAAFRASPGSAMGLAPSRFAVVVVSSNDLTVRANPVLTLLLGPAGFRVLGSVLPGTSSGGVSVGPGGSGGVSTPGGRGGLTLTKMGGGISAEPRP